MSNNILKNKGFTVVETLVAISILSLSIAATFTAVQNGIQNSTIAKDQITAFYLAQEAMEYIKNVRDQNALASTVEGDPPTTKWLTGLSEVAGDPCYFTTKVCTVDVTETYPASIETCPGALGTCPALNQDTSSGSPTYLFGYNASWPTSRFKREIQFEEVVPDTEVTVIITVTWTSSAGTKSFQAVETLFNRQ